MPGAIWTCMNGLAIGDAQNRRYASSSASIGAMEGCPMPGEEVGGLVDRFASAGASRPRRPRARSGGALGPRSPSRAQPLPRVSVAR